MSGLVDHGLERVGPALEVGDQRPTRQPGAERLIARTVAAKAPAVGGHRGSPT
jgi:hypothetical protein